MNLHIVTERHHKSNLKLIGETILKLSHSQGVSIAYIFKRLMVAILFIQAVFHHKSNLKLIGKTILKISCSQGVSIEYIFKSSMAAILFLADGPKSIASVFFLV